MEKSLPIFKYASWSPSKANLASTCPVAFRYRYIDHLPTGPKGSASKIGVTVHRVLELVLGGSSIKEAYGTALEEYAHELTHNEQEKVQQFTQNVIDFDMRIKKFMFNYKVSQVLLENKWAITDTFEACAFGDPASMVRGVVDMALVLDNGYVIVLDHKTGKPRPPSYHQTQLDFYTVMALAHFPDLKGVQCALHYVAHGEIEWSDPIKPAHIRNVLQPWVLSFLTEKTENVDAAVATPGRHCDWCDYRTICQFRGLDVKTGEGDKSCET